MSDDCKDELCLVCKNSNKTLCVVCKYKYIINKDENGKYKSCVDEGVNITIPFYEEEEVTEPPIIIQEDYDESINNDTYNNSNSSFSNIISNDSTGITYKNFISSNSIINISTNNIDKNIKIKTDYYSTIDTTDLTGYIIDNTILSEYIIQKIINNDFKNETLTTEQIMEVYKTIKEELLTENYDGQPKVITTENVVYQVSTFEYQKNNEEHNISSIDLGICQDKLKTNYNIKNNDSLIVFKIDLKSQDQKQTYVHYEIYHPYNHSLLDLSLCDSKIIVNTPVDLDDNDIMLYENLKEYGYNIFDSGDDFYNDICTTYTTVNGTDMLIEDRKKIIFSSSGNITMCQNGCEFILYNTTTKKSKCDCDSNTVSQLENNDLTVVDHFSAKKLASEFLTTMKNSNFRVLKCYKLAFDILNSDSSKDTENKKSNDGNTKNTDSNTLSPDELKENPKNRLSKLFLKIELKLKTYLQEEQEKEQKLELISDKEKELKTGDKLNILKGLNKNFNILNNDNNKLSKKGKA